MYAYVVMSCVKGPRTFCLTFVRLYPPPSRPPANVMGCAGTNVYGETNERYWWTCNKYAPLQADLFVRTLWMSACGYRGIRFQKIEDKSKISALQRVIVSPL